MAALFARLVRSGAAYQAASVLSAALALLTLPLYTRALTPADYGLAETLLVAIILASILLRLGLGESLVRFWQASEDRARLERTVTATVLVTTSAAATVAVLFAGPLSEALLGVRDAVLLSLGVLGLWAFTNLEVAYALLRVEERRRTYLGASLANVLLTVALTIVLVVVLDAGARGYVAGNYAASTVVLLALWWRLRDRLGRPERDGLRGLLRYGLPTVPADATVFALNVVDRTYLLRAESADAAGLYALAVKLATTVIVGVRAFQLAWPPLAYAIGDDDEARRFYAAVTTWYVVSVGLVVAGLALLGRWLLRVFAADRFFGAYEALPWVALGWAGYGLFLVFVVVAGRAQVTVRILPAAAAGLAVNVLLLVLLVGPLGIAGAGIALAAAYAVMVAVLALLTRRAFPVPFEGRRLAHAVVLLAGVAVAAELALPTEGAVGFALRALALLALPAVLAVTGFLRPGERAWLRRRVRRRVRR